MDAIPGIILAVALSLLFLGLIITLLVFLDLKLLNQFLLVLFRFSFSLFY